MLDINTRRFQTILADAKRIESQLVKNTKESISILKLIQGMEKEETQFLEAEPKFTKLCQILLKYQVMGAKSLDEEFRDFVRTFMENITIFVTEMEWHDDFNRFALLCGSFSELYSHQSVLQQHIKANFENHMYQVKFSGVFGMIAGDFVENPSTLWPSMVFIN